MDDQIQTLRDYKSGVILVDFDEDQRVVSEREWDEALKQVEALVEAAHAVLANQILVRYDNAADPMFNLRDALAPFKENP